MEAVSTRSKPHSRVTFFIFCLRNLSTRGLGETGLRLLTLPNLGIDPGMTTPRGGRPAQKILKGGGDSERQENLKSSPKKVGSRIDGPGARRRYAAPGATRPIAHRLGREQVERLGPFGSVNWSRPLARMWRLGASRLAGSGIRGGRRSRAATLTDPRLGTMSDGPGLLNDRGGQPVWRPPRTHSSNRRSGAELAVERLHLAPRRLVRRRRGRATLAEQAGHARPTLPRDEVASRGLSARDLEERRRRHDLDPVEHDADRDIAAATRDAVAASGGRVVAEDLEVEREEVLREAREVACSGHRKPTEDVRAVRAMRALVVGRETALGRATRPVGATRA